MYQAVLFVRFRESWGKTTHSVGRRLYRLDVWDEDVAVAVCSRQGKNT